jgi:hypothetical protein
VVHALGGAGGSHARHGDIEVFFECKRDIVSEEVEVPRADWDAMTMTQRDAYMAMSTRSCARTPVPDGRRPKDQ